MISGILPHEFKAAVNEVFGEDFPSLSPFFVVVRGRMPGVFDNNPMNTLRTCGKCGETVGPLAPDNLCVHCLLDTAADIELDSAQISSVYRNQADVPPPRSGEQTTAPIRFGDYELLEEIARGGIGVVYKARQISLDRIVAIKMLLFGPLAGRDVVQRFRAEASTAASLQHPNIVAIHEVGVHQDQHFLVMDFIEGRSLAKLAAEQPLSATRVASCVRTIAEAVHYAHERGILHRDLKPSNVLIDANDQPRVTDFGLAKRFGFDTSLTSSGQILGSPSYMPPEQIGMSGSQPKKGHSEKVELEGPSSETEWSHVATAAPKAKVGRYSDVYGLGAILYHLLTGRPPFVGETLTATLHQVENAEPLSPRLLNPSVPVDLETICLKCLEKEPHRRYQTAQELAGELGHFLDDKPIQARPASSAERFWRWCRRKPALATLGGVAMLLFLVVAIGAPVAVFRTNRSRAEAELARAGAEQDRSEAERARSEAVWNLYTTDMKAASQAVRDGAVGYARELLIRHRPKPGAVDLRGFEWRYLWKVTRQNEVVRTLAGLPLGVDTYFSPRLEKVGDTLYNAEYRLCELRNKSELRAWNITNWSPLELRLPSNPVYDRWFWRPEQQTALAADDANRTLTLHRLPGFQKDRVLQLQGIATRCAISPDCRLLAVCIEDGDRQQLSIWDLLKNEKRTVLREYAARVVQLEFSKDGKVLAVSSADGAVGLWDVTTSQPLPGPRKSEAFKPFVRFAPSGNRLSFENPSGTLQVWDPVSGESSLKDLGVIRFWGFSPDGELLAVISEDVVRLFDLKSNRRVGELHGRQSGLTSLVFSPDGTLLATAGMDRTARLWDVKRERELATLGGHDDSVYGVAFSADGGRLVTIGANGVAKVWDVPAVLERNLLIRNSAGNGWLRMSADERLLASADNEGTIHIWDRLNRTQIHSLQTGSLGELVGLTFDPQGHRLAWASRTTLGLFDLRSGQTNTIPIDGNQGMFVGIGFSPANQEVMFSSRTNVMLCDLPSMRLRPFALCQEEVYSIAYSPDGTLLAFGHQGGAVSLWDRKSGRNLSTTNQAHAEWTATVEFSRDGKWLASCGTLSINLWRVQRDGLTFSKTLRGHAGYVPSIAFSPDGTRLVSGSGDYTVKLWDTAEGIELGTLHGHHCRVSGVVFSKDGRRIFSTGGDCDVRVWEAPPLAEIDLPDMSTSIQSRTAQPIESR